MYFKTDKNMKLPWTLWQIQDIAQPTRRRFIQMWAAAIMPKPPIDIWTINWVLEWANVWSIGTELLRRVMEHWDFRKEAVTGVLDRYDIFWYVREYLEESPENIWKMNAAIQKSGIEYLPTVASTTEEWIINWFDAYYRNWALDLIKRRESLFSQLNPELLNWLALDDSWLEYDENTFYNLIDSLKWSWIDSAAEELGRSVIMNEHIVFNVTSSTWRELSITLNSSEMLNGNFEVSLSWWPYEDFYVSWTPEEIQARLQKPIDEIVADCETEILKQQEKAEQIKNWKDTKNLPMVITDFWKITDEILSWEIEITDKIRHQVWILLSS